MVVYMEHRFRGNRTCLTMSSLMTCIWPRNHMEKHGIQALDFSVFRVIPRFNRICVQLLT
jgi:hypothetical protein